ncbi:MAG: sugar porter family MFS transporter [Verrucomicrobia bacterium]|nr:sugar porter family MFS transporter [Verrucomicrobiota bacterium]
MRKLFLVFSIGALSLLSSYTIAILSGVILFLEKSYALTLLQKQELVSHILLGALVGVVLAGPFADRYGRKIALFASAFFYGVGSLLSIATSLIDVLLWGRLFTGVGVGIASVVIPLYLAEMAKAERRGAVIALFQLCVTFGIFLAYLVNLGIAADGNWKMPFQIALLLSCIGGASLFFIPESPLWLLLHHREKEAKKILVENEIAEHTHRPRKMAKRAKSAKFSDLFRKGLLSALSIAILLSIFQQITGINTVIYYGPTIFMSAGFNSLSATLFATLGLGAVNVLVTAITLPWIDRLGRRFLLLFGLTGMVVSLFILSLYFTSHIVALLALVSYLIFFAISLGPIVWVIVAEIFPLAFRGRAITLATFMNWLMNYVVSFSFLGVIEKVGYANTYFGFGIISFFALLFVYFFVPETKGKSLEEIQLYWERR